jgi:death on curing protein
LVKSGHIGATSVAKKTVHYADFDSLLAVNREVVQLTKEPHEYSGPDGEKLKELLSEVEERAEGDKPEKAILKKAAYLVFKLASGQHFRSGNKRTALVAGLVFLRKNGYDIDISNSELVSAVDKVGIAAESMDDLYEIIANLVSKKAIERSSWESSIKKAVVVHKKFLTEVSS